MCLKMIKMANSEKASASGTWYGTELSMQAIISDSKLSLLF